MPALSVFTTMKTELPFSATMQANCYGCSTPVIGTPMVSLPPQRVQSVVSPINPQQTPVQSVENPKGLGGVIIYDQETLIMDSHNLVAVCDDRGDRGKNLPQTSSVVTTVVSVFTAMGQRVNKVSPMTVGEVYEQHPSTPPTPSTNMAVQHPHPCDETPEKRKSKKWWQRLRSFFQAAKKHQSSSGQGEVEQQQQDDGEKMKVAWAARSSDDYIFSRYSVGDQLGKGAFGVVYEGRRLEDDLKVALKYVPKTDNMECIAIPDHPNPLPKEIALTILANKGRRVPEIIRLLDWTDHPDHFVIVLECPSPCENLVEFIRRHGGSLDEEKARQIMWQAVNAAHMCCLRGVLHRDVKLENLLINRETSEVKLIDFGCGDILRMSPYRSYQVTLTCTCCSTSAGPNLACLKNAVTSSALSCMRSQSGNLAWGKSWPTTGLWSSHKTSPVGVSHAALRLAGCSGRRFHPSSRLCILLDEQALVASCALA
ncbi:serine threonine- kinase pim-2-like protein [Labeo rohita]|uniref:non-specific serine/threonine protein kinase n=1 Tax=Labeo rohita TaxID=84645 RepID=A0A498M3B4_LABRO|nr:serine threonine- kinase pim-2-like protein [Labeo rohita]